MIVHVIDSIGDEASGPSYSVPRLCEALAAHGAAVQLFTVGDSGPSFASFEHKTYSADFASVPILGRLRFSSALKGALARVADSATIIHAHGLWRMSNIYPGTAGLPASNRLILSPRGMLGGAALEFSARKKQLFWMLGQRDAACAASCLHATSRQEYEDIRAFGLKAPIAIIPNGIDMLPTVPKGAPTEGGRKMLYLGRLHPKKGLDRLLDAWKLIANRHRDWRLDIVGPIDSDYAQRLKNRVEVDAGSRVRVVGPLYGEDKMKAYRQADLFVFPTLNENFGMTVAEALVQGTPVISTKGAPWAGLVRYGCGWWIDHGTEPLAATMDEAMGIRRERLASMGDAGRAWMCRDFDWNEIASSMLSVYRWLSGQGDRPSCVIIC